jgi:hypothetical protein
MRKFLQDNFKTLKSKNQLAILNLGSWPGLHLSSSRLDAASNLSASVTAAENPSSLLLATQQKRFLSSLPHENTAADSRHAITQFVKH